MEPGTETATQGNIAMIAANIGETAPTVEYAARRSGRVQLAVTVG